MGKSKRTRIAELEAELDAYKKAKSENDDRFMRERDEARADNASLRVRIDDLEAEYGNTCDELNEARAEVEQLSGLLEEVRPTIKADFGVEEADWLRRVDNALAKPEGGDDGA